MAYGEPKTLTLDEIADPAPGAGDLLVAVEAVGLGFVDALRIRGGYQIKTALPTTSDAARVHLDGVLSPQTASLLNQAADDRARWFITLASPEFQLK